MSSSLTHFLASYPAQARPTGPIEPLGNNGGLSGSLFWRYPAGNRLLAVRSWPLETVTETRLARLHAWLDQAEPLRLLPRIERDLHSRTFRKIDSRFHELMTWLPGQADTAIPPPLPRLTAAFSALAVVHQALARPTTQGPSPGLARRLAELKSLPAGWFDQLQTAVAHAGDPSCRPLASQHLALVARHLPEVLRLLETAAPIPTPLQPCLRDVRPSHFLFTGDSLTGLVDFGGMDIDNVATDLARLLSEWRLNETSLRAAALDAYHPIRPLEPAELALIPAFEASTALLGGCHWIQWHFLEARSLPIPAVRDGLTRAINQITRLTTNRGHLS